MTKAVIYMLYTALYTSSWWYAFSVYYNSVFIPFWVFGTLGMFYILASESFIANE